MNVNFSSNNFAPVCKRKNFNYDQKKKAEKHKTWREDPLPKRTTRQKKMSTLIQVTRDCIMPNLPTFKK